MSSEISQLCLEALSPLAEQCAKSQDKDTPLFIATRHFLKVRHSPATNICNKLEFVFNGKGNKRCWWFLLCAVGV